MCPIRIYDWNYILQLKAASFKDAVYSFIKKRVDIEQNKKKNCIIYSRTVIILIYLLYERNPSWTEKKSINEIIEDSCPPYRLF